jgi:hypothetical protein
MSSAAAAAVDAAATFKKSRLRIVGGYRYDRGRF